MPFVAIESKTVETRLGGRDRLEFGPRPVLELKVAAVDPRDGVFELTGHRRVTDSLESLLSHPGIRGHATRRFGTERRMF